MAGAFPSPMCTKELCRGSNLPASWGMLGGGGFGGGFGGVLGVFWGGCGGVLGFGGAFWGGFGSTFNLASRISKVGYRDSNGFSKPYQIDILSQKSF